MAMTCRCAECGVERGVGAPWHTDTGVAVCPDCRHEQRVRERRAGQPCRSRDYAVMMAAAQSVVAWWRAYGRGEAFNSGWFRFNAESV